MKKIKELSIYPSITERIYSDTSNLIKGIRDNSYLNMYANDFLYQSQAPIRVVIKKLDDWFYFHEVLGYKKETIYILKIRTMEKGANGKLKKRIEENGLNNLGKPNDNKYIKKGMVWLREHFLDEAFQIIWNITIQGNMRWAGERPKPREIWEKEIKEGLVTKKEMDETLENLPGLFGAQYRYPHLPASEARKEWRKEEKQRPGSLLLDHIIRTSGKIVTGKLKSK